MKKIVMTMVALLTMTAAVAQQNDKKFDGKAPKQPSVEQMTEHMAKDLKLDDKQKQQVLALNKEYQDVLKGPRMMHRGPRPQQKVDGQTGATEQAPKADKKDKKDKADEQKAQMKAQMEKRKEYNEKLKKILTDEQYKQFQKRQHHGPHHGGHGGPHHGGPRGPRPDQAA